MVCAAAAAATRQHSGSAMAAEVSPLLIITAWRASERTYEASEPARSAYLGLGIWHDVSIVTGETAGVTHSGLQ
ncbi:hypothetical protein PV325_005909 [Microctonus aethiopoides]|nr:hypothetical protein PV325_005909 [Microctonus aethiopoides]